MHDGFFYIYNFAGMQDFKAVCRFRKGEVWWFYLFIYLFGGSVTGLVFSARCAAYWHAPFTFGSLSVFWMLSHMLSLFCFSACGYVNGTLPCRTWSRMFAKKKTTHPWTPSSLNWKWTQQRPLQAPQHHCFFSNVERKIRKIGASCRWSTRCSAVTHEQLALLFCVGFLRI